MNLTFVNIWSKFSRTSIKLTLMDFQYPSCHNIIIFFRDRQQNVTPTMEASEPHVSSFLYHKTFNKEFNLGFERPQSGMCARRNELAIAIKAASTPEEKLCVEIHQKENQKKAIEGFKSKTEDK